MFYQDWCRQITQRRKEQSKELSTPKVENHDDDDLFSPKKETAIVQSSTENLDDSNEHEISESDREKNRKLLEDHAKFLDVVALCGRFESNRVITS